RVIPAGHYANEDGLGIGASDVELFKVLAKGRTNTGPLLADVASSRSIRRHCDKECGRPNSRSPMCGSLKKHSRHYETMRKCNYEGAMTGGSLQKDSRLLRVPYFYRP